MDANMQPHEARSEPQKRPEGIMMTDDQDDEPDDEDVEHHDVGLRRNALNILYIHRGDMFGTAIPLGNDMNETMKQIQLMVAEVYAARRQENHGN